MQALSTTDFVSPARNHSPSAVIDTRLANGRELHVIREDLLPGGTKQRALFPYLELLGKRGFTHFVYASPFAGFAQVALAYACSQLGYRCTLFVEKNPGTQKPHEFTLLAQSYGAEIIETETLEEAEKMSQGQTFKIPLGFDSDEFKVLMWRALATQWEDIVGRLGREPKNLWLPVGSGTLASIFSKIVSPHVRFQLVDVHVLEPDDLRIQRLLQRPNTELHSCDLRFAEKADCRPEIPSNVHYDAKLWSFILEKSEDGDVWWNVAR